MRLPTTLLLLVCLCVSTAHSQSNQPQEHSRETKQQIKEVVTLSFLATYNGWSSDEVILQDDLNQSFVKQCLHSIRKLNKSSATPIQPSTSELNWTLMNLRKAGKLKAKTRKRKTVDLNAVRHVAEIAARTMADSHQCSIDRMMCDPELRKEFDAIARSIDNDIDAYSVRKAAFQLRKARRLRPELITRIADWGRSIKSYSASEIIKDPRVLNEHPGVYIFRDDTGYLYIGQTDNLRERLKKHLDESHNLSLARYLKKQSNDSIIIEVHDFDPKSQASKTMVRRAYESELIASRKPRFNVQP